VSFIFLAISIPIFSNNSDYWRSCGIVETKKPEDRRWQQEGQCVVVNQKLLLTAAHVCFYEPILSDSAKPLNSSSSSSKKQHQKRRSVASLSSSSLSPPKYVPYPQIRVVFQDPQRRKEKPSAYDCRVLRFSDSMDVAILHIINDNPVPSLLPFQIFTGPLTVRTTVIMFGLYDNSPCESEGKVDLIKTLSRKSNHEEFRLANATYTKRKGLSGAAILHYDGVWTLAGIHRGADFVRFDENTPQLLNSEQVTKKTKIEASKSAPHSPVDSTSSSSSSSSSSSHSRPYYSPISTRSTTRQTSSNKDSYNPSDSSTPDLKEEESGHANVHSHTNDSWSSFAVVESVLQCNGWSIKDCIELINSSGSMKPESIPDSPPSSKEGDSGRVELQEIGHSPAQLFDIDEAEEEVDG
jgi:hypothetical protein